MKRYLFMGMILAAVGGMALYVSQKSLADGALEWTHQQGKPISDWTQKDFQDAWKLRQAVHHHFEAEGAQGQLFYACLRPKQPMRFEVVPYHISSWLDWPGMRYVVSCWQQIRVLWRITGERPTLSEEKVRAVAGRWQDISEDDLDSSQKTGRGKLIEDDVVVRQWVVKGDKINVLYNHAPLKTGGEELHFLVVPAKKYAAKDFSELDADQYAEVLRAADKIAQWAYDRFDGKTVVHVYDKTGELSGQTQPLYCAQVIVVPTAEGEQKGKTDMFWRTVKPWSTKPLSSEELKKRVQKYRKALALYF